MSGSSVMAPNVNIQFFSPSRIPEVVRQKGRATSCTRRNKDSDALMVLTPLEAS